MRKLSVLILIVSSVAFAQSAAYVDQAFLYLPDDEMKHRVADQDEFVNYAGLVMDAIEPTFASMPASEPVSFGLIVTVRGNRESKVWFSVKSGRLSNGQRDQISTAIQAIPSPKINYGVVPIAYAVRAWGATETITDFPVAPEWAEYNVEGMDAIDVIEKAWQ